MEPRALDRSRLDAGLQRLVPDPRDRQFLLRCVLDEGPPHHRLANHALLTLLVELVERIDAVVVPPVGVAVPMRVPPHLRSRDASTFPLAMDLAPLALLGPDPTPWVDALLDGPPQHSVANALMVDLLGAALAHLDRR